MPTTPSVWLDDFTANAGSARVGFQFEPQIVQLASGNIVVAWVDQSNNVDSDAGSDIIAAIYNPLGELVRAPYRLNSFATGGDEGQFDLVAQPTGGFALVHEQASGGSVLLFGDNFDADGDNVFLAAFNRGAPAGVSLNDPTMTSAANGDILYAYQRTEAGVTETRVMLRTGISPTEHVAIASSANESTGGSVQAVSAATLTSGSFVVVAQGAGANNTIRGRMIDGTGAPTGSEFTVGTSASNGRDNFGADVAALSGGGFVVAWSGESGTDTDLYFQRFNGSGTALGGTVTVASGGSTDVNIEASITALADGGFLISWRDGETNTIQAQRYGATGVPVGTAISLGPNALSAEVIGLADGRIAFVWNQNTDIRVEIVDTRDAVNGPFYTNDYQTGLVGDDTFNADAAAKIVHGWTGDDVITTNATEGAFYYGDAGDDLIVVTTPIGTGSAEDYFNGGDGTDTIDWSGSVGTSNAFYNLATGKAHSFGFQEYMAGFENLIGTNSTDNIIGSDGANILEGRGGPDDIEGRGGNDTLIGGNDADTLDGGAGADMLEGGLGDDTYVVDQFDTILELSGGGNDSVRVTTNFVLGAGADIELLYTDDFGSSDPFDITGNEIAQGITGNYGDNTLSGLDGNDVISGSLGNDTLLGGDGDDGLEGGQGADILDGGDGFDRVIYAGSNGVTINLQTGIGKYGFAQGDTLISIEWVQGSSQFDEITGSLGMDRLDGSGGNDFLNGSNGDDELFGGEGNDDLWGGAGADLLNGGNGVDTANYSTSPDAVSVNLGIASGTGGFAHGDTYVSIETVIGSAFDDTLRGTALDNTLNGGKGDDILIGGYGYDRLNGNDGIDTADYSGSSAVTVNLLTTIGSGGEATGDILTGIENLIGSAFADNLTGTTGANILEGGEGADTFNASLGDDTIDGGGGDDMMVGGAGADHFDGGIGIDWVYYSNAAAGVTVSLFANTGVGSDAAGDTFASVENLYGSASGDLLTGSDDDNTLNGYQGADTLNGLGGADVLLGGTGDDWLNGGAGDDVMSGYIGVDTFTYDLAAFGNDTIIGFEDGIDRIDLNAGLTFASFTETAWGPGTLLTLIADPANTIAILGVGPGDIDASDFI